MGEVHERVGALRRRQQKNGQRSPMKIPIRLRTAAIAQESWRLTLLMTAMSLDSAMDDSTGAACSSGC